MFLTLPLDTALEVMAQCASNTVMRFTLQAVQRPVAIGSGGWHVHVALRGLAVKITQRRMRGVCKRSILEETPCGFGVLAMQGYHHTVDGSLYHKARFN